MEFVLNFISKHISITNIYIYFYVKEILRDRYDIYRFLQEAWHCLTSCYKIIIYCINVWVIYVRLQIEF